MKRWLSLVCAVCMLLTLVPMTAGAALSTQTLSFTQMHGYYRSLGRTVEHDTCLYMDNVASGFEVYLYGSGNVVLNATVKCSDGYENAQYLSVYVDGQLSRVRVACDAADTSYFKSITLAENLTEGYHHIEVYRQTEAKISLFRAEALQFTGRLLATPPEKPLTMDVIGDSISAGYGCLWNSSLGVSDPGGNHPAYEDGTQTYAFLAGKELGADVRVTQTSGYGCVAGWNGRDVNLQTMYPLACYWRSTTFAYPFEPQADVVVINLGTNDYNTRNNNNMTNAEFKEGALNLMKTAREYNPGAPVVWCTGMMGTFYQTELTEAVAELGGAEAGYYLLILPKGTSGAVSHPTAAQQAAAGEVLASFLKDTVLGADNVPAKATASDLQSAIDTAKAVVSPSAALSGAIRRGEAELSVGTTDPYRLMARVSDIREALNGETTALSLMPAEGLSKTPTAEDGVSYIWPYYGNSDGSVGMYKGGEGLYWPKMTTAYSQTIDIDETPYLRLDFSGTASFNVSLTYRTRDGELAYVSAAALAGIAETDFPAQSRAAITVDFGKYIREQGHADDEGLVSIQYADLYVIGETDTAVRLYEAVFTDKGDFPDTIRGSYTVQNGVLTGVPSMTVESLIAAMDHSKYLSVQTADGNVAEGTLATGMVLTMTVNGAVVDSAVIAVRGDVNGDGYVSSVDARSTLVALLNDLSALSTVQQCAADMSGDGALSTTDIRQILVAALQ